EILALTYFGSTMRGIADIVSGEMEFGTTQKILLFVEVLLSIALLALMIYIGKKSFGEVREDELLTEGISMEMENFATTSRGEMMTKDICLNEDIEQTYSSHLLPQGTEDGEIDVEDGTRHLLLKPQTSHHYSLPSFSQSKDLNNGPS